MGTKSNKVKVTEEVKSLTDDGREATIAAEPATTFDERTESKTIVEQLSERE